jgi:hypothetical protein
MPTDCSPTQLAFEGFQGRQVVGAFDGGAVTSNAGALLLREADRAINLTPQVARCFRDGRDPDSVVHTIETLIAQRIHGQALGYEDVNDHDELRHDPILALLSDTLEPKRANVARLAGKSTLQRLEGVPKKKAAETGATRYHKISIDEAAMERLFPDFYLVAHKTPPERIILDLDATDVPLHDAQEAVSSTATIAATATCRSTSSLAATCWSPSCGAPTSTPRPAPSRKSRASWRTSARRAGRN